MPHHSDIAEEDRILILTEMMKLRAKHVADIKKLLHPIEHHVAVQIEWEMRIAMPPLYGK
jgi:hypothetical protein